MFKELLAAVALVLTLVMFVPYVRSIHQGLTKPHMFSWIVWALGTLIVFVAQLTDHGGIGAWPIGVSGAISAYVAVLAYLNRTDTSAAVGIACAIFVAMVAYRRTQVAKGIA